MKLCSKCLECIRKIHRGICTGKIFFAYQHENIFPSKIARDLSKSSLLDSSSLPPPLSLPFPFPFSKKCLHFIRLKSISVLLFHDYGWDIPRYHRLCNTIRQDILSSWFCLYDTTHKRNISYYNIDSYSSFKIRFFSYYNMLLRIVHHINYTRWWGIGTMRINWASSLTLLASIM